MQRVEFKDKVYSEYDDQFQYLLLLRFSCCSSRYSCSKGKEAFTKVKSVWSKKMTGVNSILMGLCV